MVSDLEKLGFKTRIEKIYFLVGVLQIINPLFYLWLLFYWGVYRRQEYFSKRIFIEAIYLSGWFFFWICVCAFIFGIISAFLFKFSFI